MLSGAHPICHARVMQELWDPLLQPRLLPWWDSTSAYRIIIIYALHFTPFITIVVLFYYYHATHTFIFLI